MSMNYEVKTSRVISSAAYGRKQIASTIRKNPEDTHFDTMNAAEIHSYLNSDRYISASLRKQLEEKLEEEKKSNRFSPLDEFFAVIAPNSMKVTKKNNETTDEYPTLGAATNITKKTSLNYGALIKQNYADEENPTIKPLFTGDKIFVDFHDIERIYKEFGIYRIRLQYLLLNKKIHILDSLSMLNHEKGTHFKNYFGYEKMVKDSIIFGKCIFACMCINMILVYLEEVKDLLKKYKTCENFIITDHTQKLGLKLNQLKSIGSILTQTGKNLAELYEDRALINKYGTYSTDYNKILSQVQLLSGRLPAVSKKNINDLVKKCTGLSLDTKNLIEKIVEDHDPHIECQYSVYFKCSTGSNIFPMGIYHSMYLDCGDDIDLSTRNRSLGDPMLQTISLEEMQSYFSKNKNNNQNTFIRIWVKHPKYMYYNINYYIAEEVPTSKVEIKLHNLPRESHALTSTFYNWEMNNFVAPAMLPPIREDWFEHKTRNSLHKITKEEYDKINPELRDAYPYEETNKNIFAVDFLFNELHKCDDTQTIIKPEMLNSFRIMAKNS